MKKPYENKIKLFIQRMDNSKRLTVNELKELYSIAETDIEFYDLIYNYGYMRGVENGK